MFYPIEKAKGLNDLKDTSIVTPKNHEVVMFDGTEWKNSDVLKEQEVIASKNLLHNDAITCDKDGIHFEVNPDGTVLANRTGTSTGTVTLGIGRLSSEYIGKTVKAVGCPAGGSPTTYEFSDNGGVNRDRGDGVTFTYNNEYFQIAIRQTEPCNNVLFKPMITEDTDATYNDYEKYWKALKDAMWSKDQQRKNGAYNLCPNDLISQVEAGITYQTLSDKTIQASGTASGSSSIWITKNIKLKKGTYKICGTPSGGHYNNSYALYVTIGTTTIATDTENALGVSDIFTVTNEATLYNLAVVIRSGVTAPSKPFKPMITTDLNATYDDYEPYAKTNRELTEDVKLETYTLSPETSNGVSGTVTLLKYGKVCVVNGYFTLSSSLSTNKKLFEFPSAAGISISSANRPFQWLVSQSDGTKHCGVKAESDSLKVDSSGVAGTYNLNVAFINA